MTRERWQKLSPREQLRHIASEVKRAALYEASDPALARTMMERAFALVDLSLADPRWRAEARLLLLLRMRLAEAYLGRGASVEGVYALF